MDEIQGLRKKTETELKLTTTPLNVTSKNINTSWNKDVNIFITFLTLFLYNFEKKPHINIF